MGEEGDYIYLSLHCHYQNDSCIKMGSDGSHFNVSLIVRDKVTRHCPQTTMFFKTKGKPVESSKRASAYQPNTLPLGQTGSQATHQTGQAYINILCIVSFQIKKKRSLCQKLCTMMHSQNIHFKLKCSIPFQRQCCTCMNKQTDQLLYTANRHVCLQYKSSSPLKIKQIFSCM